MTDAAILTISDTRAQGVRADTATPRLRRVLEEAGWTVRDAAIVPDERAQIQQRLIDFADRLHMPLVVTTGGTGFGPRDVTPEATRGVIEREAPGLAEAMRVATAGRNPLAWLSRATAGLRGRTLIINLPGHPQGAEECLRAVLPLLPHAFEMIAGHHHG